MTQVTSMSNNLKYLLCNPRDNVKEGDKSAIIKLNLKVVINVT